MTAEPQIDLKRLEHRLRTFENWPVQFIQPTDLASAGKIKNEIEKVSNFKLCHKF
jgi:hypothetical protein